MRQTSRGLDNPPPFVHCPDESCGKPMALQGPVRIMPGSVPWVVYRCDAYPYPDGSAGCARVERAVYLEGERPDLEQKWRWPNRWGLPQEVEDE